MAPRYEIIQGDGNPFGQIYAVRRNGVFLGFSLHYHEAVLLLRERMAEDLLRCMPWHPNYDRAAEYPVYEGVREL